MKTAAGWLETTPTEPPVLNSSMRAMLVALAVTANCSGISSVAFVPASSGAERGREGGVLNLHGARDAGLRADAGALVGDGGQLMEAVGEAGGVEHEADRQRGGARADVKMIAWPQVGEVVLEQVRAGRQGQEVRSRR